MPSQNSTIPAVASATPLSPSLSAPIAAAGRTSAAYPVQIAANSSARLDVPGQLFYLIVATAQVSIRPQNGVFSPYSQGTGDKTDYFSSLEINNENPFAVVLLVFVGYDNFIDNRLILASSVNPNVCFPTYQTPNSAATININDLSGQAFNDINGKKWLAISRVAILVFNLDSATTYLLQKKGAVTNTGSGVGVIYPVTPIRFDFSGDYAIATGGSNVNAIVSEIYSCILG